MKRVVASVTLLLWFLLPCWFLTHCYARMAAAYDFLDSESYRAALRNVEVAEQNVRRAQQSAGSDNAGESDDVRITEYRLTFAQNKLNSLVESHLDYYAVTRIGWEAALYRKDWPISRSVVWLVNLTHASEELVVALPPLLVGLAFYGLQLVVFAYRRRSVKCEPELELEAS